MMKLKKTVSILAAAALLAPPHAEAMVRIALSRAPRPVVRLPAVAVRAFSGLDRPWIGPVPALSGPLLPAAAPISWDAETLPAAPAESPPEAGALPAAMLLETSVLQVQGAIRAGDMSAAARSLDDLFTGSALAAFPVEPAAPARRGGSAAQRSYALGVPGRIESLAEALARERKLDLGKMTARQTVLLVQEAAMRFAGDKKLHAAPSKAALRTGLFLEDRIVSVLETGARIASTGRELFRLAGVRTGVASVLAAARDMTDLAGMEAASEAAAAEAVQAMIAKYEVGAANIAGTYVLKPADGRGDRAVRLRIEGDGTYTFKRTGLAAGSVFFGAWRIEEGRFIGIIPVPGTGRKVVHNIDLKGLLLPELERGVRVGAGFGRRVAIHVMRKVSGTAAVNTAGLFRMPPQAAAHRRVRGRGQDPAHHLDQG